MGCVGVVDVLWFALFDVLVDVFLGGRVGCWDSGRGCVLVREEAFWGCILST